MPFNFDMKASLQSGTQRFFKITSDMKKNLIENRNTVSAGALALNFHQALAVSLRQNMNEGMNLSDFQSFNHTYAVGLTTHQDSTSIPTAILGGLTVILVCALVVLPLCPCARLHLEEEVEPPVAEEFQAGAGFRPLNG